MRIDANRLLAYSTDELWEILTGEFVICFEDGDLETDHKETLYSSYIWDIIRTYPKAPFTKDMHLTHVMNGGTLSTKAWSALFSNVVWGVYLYYIKTPEYQDLQKQVLLREQLSKLLYDCVNRVYNDLTYRLEEYVTTIKIEDFLEVTNHPELLALHERPNYTEADIEAGYALGRRLLIDEPEAAKKAKDPSKAALYNNMLSRLARGGYVDMNQVNQCVVFRGFITDIDSAQFSVPITTNLVQGIRKMYDSLIESRSASKSLAFQSKPLQDSEFFNRRSQMGGMVVKHLFPGDCGSTHYLPWRVRESDLKNIEGINYLDEETGQLKYVKLSDKHLVGKTIQTRNPTMCMHPHPNGICETCFGQMAHSVYRGTNIGFQSASYMNEIMSQATLGVKHLDGSSIVRPIVLDEESRKYLSVNRSGDAYSLTSQWKGKDVWLIMRPEELPGITDLKEVSNVNDLSYTRTSNLDTITLEINTPQRSIRHDIQVGRRRRPASLTPDALQYIRDHGWEVDNEGLYRVNLKNWDTSKLLMSIPRRNFNYSDLSKEIAAMLEARKTDLDTRNSNMTKASFIMALFDLVNPADEGPGAKSLDINLAVLSTIAYSVMVINADPESIDYSLPKPWTRYGIGVYRMTITRRSLGTTLAFQEQRNVIQDPVSFTYQNRIDTPMDVFVAPKEVAEHYGKNPDYT